MADLKLNTANGSITLKPENGTGNVDVEIPRVGVGKVLQVKHAVCSPIRYTISSQELVAIPELSISFTPISPTSKLLIRASIHSSITHVASFGFQKNGTNIGGTGNTNVSSGAIATTYIGSSETNFMSSTTYEYFYSPGNTATNTYTATAASSWAGVLYSLYINDRASNDMRSTSTFTIMEIAD